MFTPPSTAVRSTTSVCCQRWRSSWSCPTRWLKRLSRPSSRRLEPGRSAMAVCSSSPSATATEFARGRRNPNRDAPLVPARRGRRRRGRARLSRRRRETADDEDLLAGLDEAELASGDLLDSGWILGQTARRFAQERVLRALPRDRGSQLIVLTLRAPQGQQAAIADKRVHHQQGDAEQEQDPDDLLGARDGTARGSASLAGVGEMARHVRPPQ